MSQFSLFLLLALFLTSQAWASNAPECGRANAKTWMNYSEGLISLRNYRLSNTNPRLRKLEEVILRNALITKAYAGLYRMERERTGENEVSQYLWLPAAAFASFEVGQNIRHGYLTLKHRLKVMGTLEPKVYGENPLNEIFILGRLALTGEQVAINLGNGNYGVYEDLFWQHLSTVKCGIDNTIGLLVNLQRSVFNPRDRERYAILEKGWRKIQAGMDGQDWDSFLQGNLSLTYVEQKYTLQPLVYDGPLGQLGGTLFAQLAKSPVKDPDLHPNRTFLEFCRDELMLPNFSNFKSRWAWMTEQLSAMYDFFNGPYAERVRDDHLFFIADSQELLTYLPNKSRGSETESMYAR